MTLYLVLLKFFVISNCLLQSPLHAEPYHSPNINMDNLNSSIIANYDKDWETNPLLPKDTIPQQYEISLNPDLNNGTFTGNVKINVEITKPRNTLIVHIFELAILKSEVFNENGVQIETVGAFEEKANQFWVILLKETVVPGKYELRIDFKGSLTGKIVGFYRSTYNAPDGQKRFIVTTKFEPTYARYAFPCFDEPSFKAEFTVHIARPSGDNYFALSNMNQLLEKPDFPSAGLTQVSFAPSPPMSTYLVCFIVCDFEHLESVQTKDGTPITVFARPGQTNKTLFARSVAQKAMNYFIDYFNIEYPLPKIDLIAVPDFVSGAMENWGLITFRETQLLITEEDSVSDHERTASTVSHELAHMWFGDLVTMAWWDDLWLNEGFATFLSHKVVDIIEKDLFSNMKFVVEQLQPVLEQDAALSSHPIIQPVNHPDQITEIFDAISYSKGSSVLRMFESFSPEAFQSAVSTYLKKYKLKNALTVNLWSEMETKYNLPNATRLFDSWTKQMGCPLVNARKEGDKLILSQNRFLSDSSTKFDPKGSPYEYKWDIPIMYITSQNPSKVNTVILPMDKNEVGVDIESDVEWFKINSQQYGFYRVNYTEKDWLNFAYLLNAKVFIHAEDRANLIDDSFGLAKAGYISYYIPFNLVAYLRAGTEDHFIPWMAASKHINRYKNILYNTTAYAYLMKFGSNILSHMITDDFLEVDNITSNLDSNQKATLAAFACRMEVPKVLEQAQNIFNTWIEGKSKKPNSIIRELIYKYGLRGVNESANRKKIWELYLKEMDPLEKGNYMAAIASVSNPESMANLLDLMKDENNVRSQDYFSFIFTMCSVPEGSEYIWNYIRKNWDYYVKRFTLNHRSLGLVLPRCTSYFSTEEKLREVEDFIKSNPDAGAGATGRKRALETIKNNIKWRQTYYQNIEDSLKQLTK